MKVLIIGAAGMIGRKIAGRLVVDGRLGDRMLSGLRLADVVAPEPMSDADIAAADLSEPGAAEALIADRPDVIMHLAAIVSGEAEAELEKGYRINLDGSRLLFDAIRRAHEAEGWRPRVVFASSIAVFGAPFPEKIGDEFLCAPLTSYGAQKAMAELVLNDYSRRGIMDGIGLRLPTICVRPGRPNKAASGFFSNILREPIAGQEAVLPVEDDVRHWFASPRSAVGFFLHAATMDLDPVGPRRCLNMPGLSATVGEQIAALDRVVGPQAVKLIRREPDETIRGIVAGWPRDFAPERAKALGFTAETDFDQIIRVHLEDELGR
jgi:nucleoside-diphosphate-sugar epimerase